MPNLESKISKVFDSMSGNSSLVHLSVQEADQFIDYVIDESTILKEARVKRMSKPIANISKVGIWEKILHPATRGQALDSSRRTEATTSNIQLSTKELIGEVKIHDDEMEDNLEGDAFADHLMRMIAKQASNQLENDALYGRIVANGTETEHLFDGWITRIRAGGNLVDAANSSLFSDRYISQDKLAAGYKSIPTKFRKWLDRIYMPNDLLVDYSTIYNTSQNQVSLTSFGKKPFIEAPGLSIENPVVVIGGASTTASAASAGASTITVASASGISAGEYYVIGLGTANQQTVEVQSVASLVVTLVDPLVVDVINNATFRECTLDGSDVLMTAKDNLIRGIQRDITIEPTRAGRERSTYYTISLRCDFQVEEVTAAGLIHNIKVK